MLNKNRWNVSLMALIGGCLMMTGTLEAASVTINGPAALQSSLIADTTNLYNATITPSSFFPGSYTINLLSKKPPVICPACPVCPTIGCGADYVYGFVGGMEKERKTDLGILASNIVNCSTDTVCSDTMNQTYGDIYQQSFSTPTIINVP